MAQKNSTLPIIVRIVLAVLNAPLAGFFKYGVDLTGKRFADFVAVVSAVATREGAKDSPVDAQGFLDLAFKNPDSFVYRNGYLRSVSCQTRLDAERETASKSKAERKSALAAYVKSAGITL